MGQGLETGWMAYLGLGANLPWTDGTGTHTPEETLRRAVGALGELGTVTAGSGLWRTEPVGPVTDQPAFVNSAAALLTPFRPKDLLHELGRIEERFGRIRAEAKGPRTLDLDMLLVEEVLGESARLPGVAFSWELKLPHPEMDRRRFVLEPLAEIAPELKHPLLNRRVRELLRDLIPALPHGERVERLNAPALVTTSVEKVKLA